MSKNSVLGFQEDKENFKNDFGHVIYPSSGITETCDKDHIKTIIDVSRTASKPIVAQNATLPQKDWETLRTECLKEFSNSTPIPVDLDKFAVPATVEINCSMCYRVFDFVWQLEIHQREKHFHQLGLELFKCSNCNRAFLHLQSLMNHTKCAHSGKQNSFWDTTFSRLRKGQGHLLDTQEEDLSQHKIRSESFFSNSKLEIQRKKYLEQMQFDPLRCEECDAAYAHKFSLDDHKVKNHSIKRDSSKATEKIPKHARKVYPNVYKCELCGEEFNRLKHFTSHQANHLSGSGSKPTPCNNCKRTFIFPSDLTYHENGCQKKHHQFYCQICGVSMYNRTHLMDHTIACHSEHKLEECPMCHLKFESNTLEYDINLHIVAHADEELPYKCLNCSAGFKFFRTLKLHEVKSGHQRKPVENQDD